jgi:hypothetical protein
MARTYALRLAEQGITAFTSISPVSGKDRGSESGSVELPLSGPLLRVPLVG